MRRARRWPSKHLPLGLLLGHQIPIFLRLPLQRWHSDGDTETRRRVRVRDSIDGSEHEQNSDDDDHAHRYSLALLLTRLLLLSSLLEQIIQNRIDPSLINVAPERAIGSNRRWDLGQKVRNHPFGK